MSAIPAALAGSMSGLTAQILTTPLDVARTRIMASTKVMVPVDVNYTENNSNRLTSEIAINNSERNGDVFKTLQDMIALEGPLSLFKGILPRVVRALASGAIQFASYELTQNAMK